MCAVRLQSLRSLCSFWGVVGSVMYQTTEIPRRPIRPYIAVQYSDLGGHYHNPIFWPEAREVFFVSQV